MKLPIMYFPRPPVTSTDKILLTGVHVNRAVWSASCPTRFTLGKEPCDKNWMENLVGPTASMNAVKTDTYTAPASNGTTAHRPG